MTFSPTHAEAIVAAIEAFLAETPGYADVRGRAFVDGELLAVKLHHPLSASEQHVVERSGGGTEGVLELRAEVLRSLQADLAGIVERTLGVTVAAVLVAGHIDPDIDLISFLSAPGPGGQPTDQS